MNNTLIKKKKILFIVPLPPPFAGPEVSSQILINSSLKDHFDIICLKSNIHKVNAKKGSISLLSILRLAVLLFRASVVIAFKRPFAVYTILTANNSGFIRDALFVLQAKLFGKKVILHFRGASFDNFYKSKNRLFQRFIRFILSLIDSIVVQAHWIKEQIFQDFLPANRLHVIYNALPDDLFKDLNSIQSKKDESIIKVVFMNHLSISKGSEVLFEAIKLVAGKTDKINFIIAGDIVDKERNIFFDEDGKPILFKDINVIIADTLKDKKLSERIEMIGEVRDTHRKLELLKSADIFVLPSFSEGCPMSVLEAIAVGLPVIVTPVGSLREIIKEGENGMFVKFADPEDLCKKIIALANDPQLRKAIGEQNKSLIRAKFCLDTIASQLSAVFEKL